MTNSPLWGKSHIGFFALLALLTFENCSNSASTEDQIDKSTQFSKAEMGDAWPFKDIESGIVSCSPEGGVIFTANNGKTYAINGWAQTLIKGAHPGWVSLNEIHIMGKNVGPILERGKKMCQETK